MMKCYEVRFNVKGEEREMQWKEGNYIRPCHFIAGAILYNNRQNIEDV